MKAFQIVQKHYAILGIGCLSQQSTQNYPNPFNEKILVSFLFYGCILSSHFIYIFHVASGYTEYIESISATCGVIITLICYATVVFKRNAPFKLIENVEQFIATSEKVSNYPSF